MTTRARLAAVPEPAAPSRRGGSKPKAKTVAQAASDSDRRGRFRWLRWFRRLRIAADIDNPNTPPRDIAALSRRLMEIGKDIEALDARDREGDASAVTPDESFDASSL